MQIYDLCSTSRIIYGDSLRDIKDDLEELWVAKYSARNYIRNKRNVTINKKGGDLVV